MSETKASVSVSSEGVSKTKTSVSVSSEGVSETKTSVSVGNTGVSETEPFVSVRNTGVSETEASVSVSSAGVSKTEAFVSAGDCVGVARARAHAPSRALAHASALSLPFPPPSVATERACLPRTNSAPPVARPTLQRVHFCTCLADPFLWSMTTPSVGTSWCRLLRTQSFRTWPWRPAPRRWNGSTP